jgi:hypothetical protein
VFKQSNLPIATDFPLFFNQPRLRCCPPDSPSRLPTPDSIVNRSFSLHSGICTLRSRPNGLLYMYLHFSIRPRPIRFTTVKNPLLHSPSPASPHPIHHTVKNPPIDSYGYINKDHSNFPDDKKTSTPPTHHPTMVVVRYRVLYHQHPLIASLPLYLIDLVDGPFTF